MPVELLCFDAARQSYEAMATGAADLCFLAVDPARRRTVAFTAPYVLIEGVYVVPGDSPLRTVADVDRRASASASSRAPPTTSTSRAPWRTPTVVRGA